MARKNALLFPSVVVFIVGAAYLAMAIAEAAALRFIIAGALIAASIVVFVIGRRLSDLHRSPPGGGPSDVAHLRRMHRERLDAVLWEQSGINPENSGRAKRILEDPDDKFPLG